MEIIKPMFRGDKCLAIEPGRIVKVEYVHVNNIIIACNDSMSIGDVKLAYELIKQNEGRQLFPCPIGYWKDDKFVLVDGRHSYYAYRLNGFEYIMVAWQE